MQKDRMGIGSWALIAALVVMLAASVALAYFGWTYDAEGAMPVSLLVPMTLGILFSLVVGCGLMALVFYSSRKGYDEPPQNLDPDDHER